MEFLCEHFCLWMGLLIWFSRGIGRYAGVGVVSVSLTAATSTLNSKLLIFASHSPILLLPYHTPLLIFVRIIIITVMYYTT